MANETMRIFFPLKIFSYPQYDCSEDEQEYISSRDAVSYEDQILAPLQKRIGTSKMIEVLPSTFTTKRSSVDETKEIINDFIALKNGATVEFNKLL